jgi:hypothetical protein
LVFPIKPIELKASDSVNLATSPWGGAHMLDKRTEANRANAKRSTGPRTAEGKARASKNALAHGLTARDIVIGDEDPQEFERLRERLLNDFEPTSTLELELVERLAGLLWRLRRIPVLEGALLDARQEETSSAVETDYTLPVTVMQRNILILSWDLMQRPEDQAFRKRFHEGPYGVRKSDDDEKSESGHGDESGSKPSASPAEKPDELRKPESPPYDRAKDPERYASQRLRLRIADPERQSIRSVSTGLALIKDAEKHDVLSKLARYEASLANAVNRTLSLLHSIKSSGLVHNHESHRR